MICQLCKRDASQKLTLTQILSFQSLNKQLDCNYCLDKFQKINLDRSCNGCGRAQDNQSEICNDCRRWNDEFKNTALFEYDQSMKDFFNQYKFMGDYLIGGSFAITLDTYLNQIKDQFDLIIPIPIDESTWLTRGFNQVIGLAPEFDWTDILASNRSDNQKHQYQKSRIERIARNNTFQVCEESRTKLREKSVLLVDDIYTTGTTLRQARDVLQKYGTKHIESITLCR